MRYSYFHFSWMTKKMKLSNVHIQVCLHFAISCLFTISFAFSSQQPEYPGLSTKLSNIIFLFWVLEDHQIRKKMTNMRLYRPQKLLWCHKIFNRYRSAPGWVTWVPAEILIPEVVQLLKIRLPRGIHLRLLLLLWLLQVRHREDFTKKIKIKVISELKSRRFRDRLMLLTKNKPSHIQNTSKFIQT